MLRKVTRPVNRQMTHLKMTRLRKPTMGTTSSPFAAALRIQRAGPLRRQTATYCDGYGTLAAVRHWQRRRLTRSVDVLLPIVSRSILNTVAGPASGAKQRSLHSPRDSERVGCPSETLRRDK